MGVIKGMFSNSIISSAIRLSISLFFSGDVNGTGEEEVLCMCLEVGGVGGGVVGVEGEYAMMSFITRLK